jgi:hypothetical protein
MLKFYQSFSDSITLNSEKVNSGSEHIIKFMQVLDALNEYKAQVLYGLEFSKNAIHYKNILHLKREILEGSYIRLANFMNLETCECLYSNLEYIFRYKGTLKGATRFYTCISRGRVSFDISRLYLKPNYYILLGAEYGIPESIELAQIQEEEQLISGNIRYLFDGSNSEIKNRIVLKFESNLFNNAEFISYVRYTVPYMFPHIHQQTEIVIERF